MNIDKRTAWIIAGHDGLTSCYTGVGVVVAEYLTELHRVFNNISDVDILTFGPEISSSSSIYNHELSNKTKSLSSFYSYIPLKGSESGPEIWGGVSEWCSASRHLADFVENKCREYQNVYVIAHDTIFLQARKCLGENNLKNIRFFFVPHSLSFIFSDKYSGELRKNFEIESLASLTPEDSVVTLSQHVRTIIERLNIGNRIRCIDCYNGVPTYECSEIPKKAVEILSNPNTFTFLFVGRATEQKGVVSFLDQFKDFFAQCSTFSFVGFLPAETDEYDYYNEIKQKATEIGFSEIYMSSKFIFGISKKAFRMLNNGCVVFNSMYETAPITPLEAIDQCDSNIPIIYSNIDAHKDLFNLIPNCFVIEPKTEHIFFKSSRAIRMLPEKYNFSLAVRKIIENV